jgi:hypothetical protein
MYMYCICICIIYAYVYGNRRLKNKQFLLSSLFVEWKKKNIVAVWKYSFQFAIYNSWSTGTSKIRFDMKTGYTHNYKLSRNIDYKP